MHLTDEVSTTDWEWAVEGTIDLALDGIPRATWNPLVCSPRVRDFRAPEDHYVVYVGSLCCRFHVLNVGDVPSLCSIGGNPACDVIPSVRVERQLNGEAIC